jgi:hypothetical protein
MFASAVASAAPTRVTSRLLRPSVCFWVAGILIYGAAAVNFAGGHFLNQSSRDLWQHLAALRALIADPVQPANPFVPGMESSRHFHPYWVSLALIARTMGWNEWQAIAYGGFITAGVLLAGIYSFGRAFYRTPWGPLALLAAMVLSWSWPVSHTGFHSLGTLIEGIAYPAALLIGLSLLLWALIITAFDRPKLAPLIVPLAAFMFATHQLGAGIGFIAAACFIAFQPAVALHRRALVAASLGAGILLSATWPYQNPFASVLRAGNASWTGGPDFYSLHMFAISCIPSLIGLAGLRQPQLTARAKPVLAAFALFTAMFAVGWFGPLIATRFVMPAVLMLHIGVGALLLKIAAQWNELPKARQLRLFGVAFACLVVQVGLSSIYLNHELHRFRKFGSDYAAVKDLTRDIGDQLPVAAYDIAAWPIVATGQRVFSVPWPEPGIRDLAERQALTERLFDPNLTRSQRIALARRHGVRYLVMDLRGPIGRRVPPGLVEKLSSQSIHRTRFGPFLRFDLY